MKVMQLLPELNSGGVEGATLDMAQALVAAGHESLVVSNGGRLVPALTAQGSRHLSLPIHRKALSSLWQVRPLRQLILQERPDVVHVRSRVPAWILHLALRRIPPAQRPARVSTVHGFYSVNRYSQIMTVADRVIAVSDSVVQYILNAYPQCPPERIVRIYEGIDPAIWPHGHQPSAQWWAQVDQAFPQLMGKRWLTLPGRITRLKGQLDFVTVMQALRPIFPDLHGVIVGGADARKQGYLDELTAAIRAAGLTEHITLTGARQDMRDWLAASSVVLSLSTQAETFGRTVLEALALGRPVVGWSRGGVAEILQLLFAEGQVSPGDFDGLVQTIGRLLLAPPRLPPVTQLTLADTNAQTLTLYAEVVRHRAI